MNNIDRFDTLAFLDRLFMDSGLTSKKSTIFYHHFKLQSFSKKDLEFLSKIHYTHCFKTALIPQIAPSDKIDYLECDEFKKFQDCLEKRLQDLCLCSKNFQDTLKVLHQYLVNTLQEIYRLKKSTPCEQAWLHDRMTGLILCDPTHPLDPICTKKITESFERKLKEECRKISYSSKNPQSLAKEFFLLMRIFEMDMDDHTAKKIIDVIKKEKKSFWWKKRSRSVYSLLLKLFPHGFISKLTQGWIYFLAKNQINHAQNHHYQSLYYFTPKANHPVLKKITFGCITLATSLIFYIFIKKAFALFVLNLAVLFIVGLVSCIGICLLFAKKLVQSDASHSEKYYFFSCSKMIPFFEKERKNHHVMSTEKSFLEPPLVKTNDHKQLSQGDHKQEKDLGFYRGLCFLANRNPGKREEKHTGHDFNEILLNKLDCLAPLFKG